MVLDFYGQLSNCTSYQEKHSRLYSFGVVGLSYPPHTLPIWQKYIHMVQNHVLGHKELESRLRVVKLAQSFSVTKINTLGWIEMIWDVVFTPHQCSYSDRNPPYGMGTQFRLKNVPIACNMPSICYPNIVMVKNGNLHKFWKFGNYQPFFDPFLSLSGLLATIICLWLYCLLYWSKIIKNATDWVIGR